MTTQDDIKKEDLSEGVDSKVMEEFGHWQKINRLITVVMWSLCLSLCVTIFAVGVYCYGNIDLPVHYSVFICTVICYICFPILANFKPARLLKALMLVASSVALLAWSWCLVRCLTREGRGGEFGVVIAFGLFFLVPVLFALPFSLWDRFARWRFMRKAQGLREKKMKRLRNVLARKIESFLGRHPSITFSGPNEFVFLSGGWLTAVFGTLAAALTAYFYIGGIEWGDWTIADEKELRLEKRDVPDEDNAYIALMALTNLYHVADNGQEHETSGADSAKAVSDRDFVRYYGDPFNREDREARAVGCSDLASQKRAEKILADNAKFFEAFRAALSRKDFQVPETIIPGRCPAVPNLPNLQPIVNFAQLIMLKAQIEFAKGNVNRAISGIRDIHTLGQMMVVKIGPESGAFVQFLVGELLKKLAYGKMCDFIGMGKSTGEMLDMFFKMVDEDDAVASANRERVLKAEWEMQFRVVDWFCDVVHKSTTYDKCIKTIYEGIDEGACPRPWKDFDLVLRILWHWPGIRGFALNRREINFHVAEILRATIAKKDLDEELARIMPSNDEWYSVFVPNGLGKVLVASLTPDFEGFFIAGSLVRSRTRLILAAEKWRRAHGGKNPPTLDALVPDYLAVVPVDPWDKASGPIKYDAASGVAWSIGKDGKYDYRKVTGKGMVGNDDTKNLAFRLDAQPIIPVEAGSQIEKKEPVEHHGVTSDKFQIPDGIQIVRADPNPAKHSRVSWKLLSLSDVIKIDANQIRSKLVLIREPEVDVTGSIASVKPLSDGLKGFLVTANDVSGEGRLGLSYDGCLPVYYDVKVRRPWLVPVASCRSAMKGKYGSAVFLAGLERGLAEGAIISPSKGKCGYRVLSISDNCVWFEAFYGDDPPEDKLPLGPWPDFSRIDTTPPVPPPGRLLLGKRQFWPGDAIKLPNSGRYLMVDDFLEGKGVVFRLLDSSMRPVQDLLCVIVCEQ